MRRFGLTDQRAFVTRARPIRPLIGERIARVVEIELRARDVRLARGDVGLGLAKCRDRHLLLRR